MDDAKDDNTRKVIFLTARRTNGRVTADFSVELGSPGAARPAAAVDLSTGGMFIESREDVAVGDELAITFTLPDGRPIRAAAVVRWVREASAFRDEEKGFGVQFRDFSEADRAAIAEWITAESLPARLP